ncbi:MAG: ParA family protein [Planctomycetota bacterium]|nr:MAG: ParA family protein [Planctomycetota bacterium]
MHVVAVANQKGGVGKTTASISLAASLAKKDLRVLLVDMDPQGNCGAGLGVACGSEEASLYEVLARGTPIERAAKCTPHPALETLRLLPAGPRLARAESELPGQVAFDELLKHRLARVRDDYDLVVVDCPPSLGALTINGLGAADLVLAPVQCEFFAARGVVKLVELVRTVRERRNPALALRLVPSLYDKRNNICRAVLAELRKTFPSEVSEVVVGVDTRVRESQARGTPLCVFAPRSRAAVAYTALAEEVRGLMAQGARHAQAA